MLQFYFSSEIIFLKRKLLLKLSHVVSEECLTGGSFLVLLLNVLGKTKAYIFPSFLFCVGDLDHSYKYSGFKFGFSMEADTLWRPAERPSGGYVIGGGDQKLAFSNRENNVSLSCFILSSFL